MGENHLDDEIYLKEKRQNRTWRLNPNTWDHKYYLFRIRWIGRFIWLGTGSINGPFLQELWSQNFRFFNFEKLTIIWEFFLPFFNFVAMLRVFPSLAFFSFGLPWAFVKFLKRKIFREKKWEKLRDFKKRNWWEYKETLGLLGIALDFAVWAFFVMIRWSTDGSFNIFAKLVCHKWTKVHEKIECPIKTFQRN